MAAIKLKSGVVDIMNALIGGKKPKSYDNMTRPKLNELVIQTRKAIHNHATAARTASDDDEAEAEGSVEEDGVPLTGASFRVGGDDRIRVLSIIFHECSSVPCELLYEVLSLRLLQKWEVGFPKSHQK